MSGFYIGVDGKARKVKGVYIGVDGVARKVKKGYIGVGGVARLGWSDVAPVFANNTWEQIAAACQSGSVPETWAIGDQKTMTIDGVDYAIDIIGKDHDEYSDGSGKAPLTFQLHDCYNLQAPMHGSAANSVGWNGCAMRKTTLPSILAKMPPEVQSCIKTVNKKTYKGNYAGTVETSADSLFLLSEAENGVRRLTSAGEGEQYAYYTDKPIKKHNGYAASHWTRSPYADTFFCYVNSQGTSVTDESDTKYYVAFAFCF